MNSVEDVHIEEIEFQGGRLQNMPSKFFSCNLYYYLQIDFGNFMIMVIW